MSSLVVNSILDYLKKKFGFESGLDKTGPPDYSLEFPVNSDGNICCGKFSLSNMLVLSVERHHR